MLNLNPFYGSTKIQRLHIFWVNFVSIFRKTSATDLSNSDEWASLLRDRRVLEKPERLGGVNVVVNAESFNTLSKSFLFIKLSDLQCLTKFDSVFLVIIRIRLNIRYILGI